MKFASWNVNSIRARLPLVEEFIKMHKPDVLFMQETKCRDEEFPFETFEDLGYNIEHHGQKTFNGVAILSKFPFEGVSNKKIPLLEDDQTRYLEVGIKGLTFINVYVPNGQDPSSDKYVYKLKFLDHLYEHLKSYTQEDIPFILAGDFNVALTPEDTAIANENMICFTPKERQRLNKIINLGLVDMQRQQNVEGYTWWDYRGFGFSKGIGMRLDYIMLHPTLVKEAHDFKIDLDFRKAEKPSDHAPLLMQLKA